MKNFLSRFAFLTTALALSSFCYAQKATEPVIAKGSVFVYDVKENSASYQYTVTVTKFSKADGIELKWTTNESPARSGTTTMIFSALDEAKRLKAKPVPGDEKLPNDQLRIFFSDVVASDLVDSRYVYVDIDRKEMMLLHTSSKAETTETIYNGKKQSFDYTGGEAAGTVIGLIAVGNYQLVHTFRSKEISLTLKSISGK